MKVPLFDGPFYRGVPCTKADIRRLVWGDVGEGVAEETRAAVDGGRGQSGIGNDLEGI